MRINPGDVVIVVLHTPREKLVGVLNEIEPAGVFIRAIDLGYFDDWCNAIANGEPHLPMSDCFLPMWRVERITRDRSADSTPSLRDLFAKKTGRDLVDL